MQSDLYRLLRSFLRHEVAHLAYRFSEHLFLNIVSATKKLELSTFNVIYSFYCLIYENYQEIKNRKDLTAEKLEALEAIVMDSAKAQVCFMKICQYKQ